MENKTAHPVLSVNGTDNGEARSNPKYWYAVYVRFRHEKRVRDVLMTNEIECFLPIQEEIRQWSDRKKKVERVLIPMMLFVRIEDKQRVTVLSNPSVSGFVRLRGESNPARIPDDQMERFKFMVGAADSAIQFTDQPLTPGEKVRVVRGPLCGLEGELTQVDGDTVVYVRLDCLGCASVRIAMNSVEKI